MAAAMEAQAEAQAAEAARLAAVVEAAAAEAARCEAEAETRSPVSPATAYATVVAAASARRNSAQPATVTFAAIKQLREQCPFADMKMCKEALRDHGCDIAFAAKSLEVQRGT